MIKGEVPEQVQVVLQKIRENASEAGLPERAVYASNLPAYAGASKEIRIGHNIEVGFPTLVFKKEGWFSRDPDGRDTPISYEEAASTAACFFTG